METSELTGRELDIEVAVQVMGWVRTGDNDHTTPRHIKGTLSTDDGHQRYVETEDYASKGPHPRIVNPEKEAYYLCRCSKDRSWQEEVLPHYSTDIAAAWQIVEKLSLTVAPMGGGWCAAHCNASGGNENLTWIGTTNGTIWSPGDYAPEAICRAALAFVNR